MDNMIDSHKIASSLAWVLFIYHITLLEFHIYSVSNDMSLLYTGTTSIFLIVFFLIILIWISSTSLIDKLKKHKKFYSTEGFSEIDKHYKILKVLFVMLVVLSLAIQLIRLYDRVIPEFGISNTVIIVEIAGIMIVTVFAFFFYKYDKKQKHLQWDVVITSSTKR